MSKLTAKQIEQFTLDGYLMVKGLFDTEEMDLLLNIAKSDQQIEQQAQERLDLSSGRSKLWITSSLGEDIYSAFVRCPRIVDPIEQMLGGEVYHYHHKMMLKEPFVGGAWEWHQDYGYWYKNQFMFPDQLISVMVALTDANKENGCLQIIKNSHKLGKVNHGFAGEQVGADMVMVNNALKTMELIYCELEAGDALFFHSNLLHRSEANLSEHPRWSIISCYSSQSNLAYNETSTSWYTPVNTVPDEAILEWKAQSLSEADFLKKENDPALKQTGWEEPVIVS